MKVVSLSARNRSELNQTWQYLRPPSCHDWDRVRASSELGEAGRVKFNEEYMLFSATTPKASPDPPLSLHEDSFWNLFNSYFQIS